MEAQALSGGGDKAWKVEHEATPTVSSASANQVRSYSIVAEFCLLSEIDPNSRSIISLSQNPQNLSNIISLSVRTDLYLLVPDTSLFCVLQN